MARLKSTRFCFNAGKTGYLAIDLGIHLGGVLDSPKPEIDLVNFGESSIDFVVRYWTRPEQREVRRVQTLAVIAIKQKFDEENIVIPDPIRTVYHHDQESFNERYPA